MDLGPIKQKIKQNEFLKKIVFYSITSPKNPKPRCWVKWFVNPWIHKKGKGAIIRRRRSRIDVFPWNQFTVGKNTVIEDFTTINNGAGDVIIGDNARIGIGSVVIGPVRFKNKVGLGQHVFISGFNHGYEDGNMDSNEQPLVKKIVVIDEDSHIGAMYRSCITRTVQKIWPYFTHDPGKGNLFPKRVGRAFHLDNMYIICFL